MADGVEREVNGFILNLKRGVVRLHGRRRNSLANERNRRRLIRFNEEMQVNGIKPNTRISLLRSLHSFAEFLGSKDFEDTTKEDVLKFLFKARGGA